MKNARKSISLANVQAVYDGPEGDLWELIMGEQVHLGGLQSSQALADRASIRTGSVGVDLCCCTGAGMRFLRRFRQVASMTGVDATPRMVTRGRRRCEESGMADSITFLLGDACSSGLPSARADFVWGEDAWCYVVDKEKLVSEAVRLVKPGGVIAFTDWIEGPSGLTEQEAERFLTFMKFANVQDLGGYRRLLEARGCELLAAEDTGRFAPCMDLYLNMVGTQFTYDALRILGFDSALMAGLREEMVFMQQLAHASKIAQGLFVARKK